MELINGDCLKEMDKLIEQGVKVDCIITDPPYKCENHGGGKTELAQRKLVKDKHIDFMSNSFEYDKVFNRFLKLAKIPNFLIFCSNKQVSSIMQWFENKNLSTTLLAWNKTNPSPFCNGKHVSDLEFVVYVRGKGAIFNNEADFSSKRKLYTSPVVSKKDRYHPAQKPIDLLEQYIKLHTNAKNVILDCYMGSGSTGIACVNTNRDFIGIEIDKEKTKGKNKDQSYFDIAKERIEQAQKIKEQSFFV